MAEYFSPGVYIEEYDNSPRSIEGVGTSTAGFVGLAEKGPTVGAPSLVTNFKSFIKQFGGFLSEFTHGEYRYLANSVEQFFINQMLCCPCRSRRCACCIQQEGNPYSGSCKCR